MKIFNTVVPIALLVVAAGCQSDETRTVSRSATATERVAQTLAPPQNAPPTVVQQEPNPTTIQQVTTDKATYTIKTIPNPRLTPTSREGDESNHIYSSNIIAVYVQTNNAVTVSSTNAPAVPTVGINSPPQNK